MRFRLATEATIEDEDMKVTNVITFGAILPGGIAAWAQEYPRLKWGLIIPTCVLPQRFLFQRA
jgi:hypothetical protein